MKGIVRDSKFRHVFGEPWKSKFEDIRLATKPTESSGVKGNSMFIAFPWASGGGGSLAVVNQDKPGRLPYDQPCIIGHQGGILDFEFDPFDDYQVLTASEDTNLRVFNIPKEGLKTHLKDSVVELKHHKKVHLASYHPTANKVIATASYDHCIRVWDAAEEEEMLSLEISDLPNAIKWDYDGSRLAVSCKDKLLRIVDPRTKEVVAQNKIHDGAKAAKICWLGTDSHNIVSTGFSSQAERQVAVWDLRQFSSTDPSDATPPLNLLSLDQGTGALYPTYDPDTKLLFLAGKGDGNVRFFEYSSEFPFLHYISDFRSTRPQKGFDFLPKHAVDVSRHEVMRGLKLENTLIEPISFLVPRKSAEFQDDLYPETYAGVAVLTGAQWMSGETKPPKFKSMVPGRDKGRMKTEGFLAIKTMKEVKADLVSAQARVLELEAENEQLKQELAALKAGACA